MEDYRVKTFGSRVDIRNMGHPYPPMLVPDNVQPPGFPASTQSYQSVANGLHSCVMAQQGITDLPASESHCAP